MLNELKKYLKKYPDTQSMELLIADMHGFLKGKRIQRQDFEKVCKEPFAFCGGVVMLTALGETVPGIPYGEDDGDPDIPASLVAGSIVPVPWSKRPMAQAMFRLQHPDGGDFFADPRAILERALQPLRKRRLKIVMATELEFYLLDANSREIVAGAPRVPGSDKIHPGTQVYSPDDLWEIDDFLNDVYAWCKAQGVPAESAISEYAPGQFEINLRHIDDPVLACDHAVMLKRIVKAAARKHGFTACFMAKPFAQGAGCGLHIHMSLVDSSGANFFSHGRDKMAAPPYSSRLRYAVGGLLKTMPEATAIFAPNANSYRRLRPDMFAPVDPNWGPNHRVVAVRIPMSDANNLRLEHRTAGADANPYLVTACIAAGIDHGLRDKVEPPRMIEQGENVRIKAGIPLRWEAALDKFSRSKVLPKYLGEDYCRYFVRNRRAESNKFHNTVSAQDFEWYLRSV